MDNYHGDLTDILRASSGSLGQSNASISNWEFPTDPTINLPSGTMEDDHDTNRDNFFGDPFCNMRDPLLHELKVAGSGYFSLEMSTTDPIMVCPTSVTDEFCGPSDDVSNILVVHHNNKVFEGDVNKNSCNINMLSRIQISPGANNPSKLPLSPCDSHVMHVPAGASPSPRGFKAGPMVSGDIINSNSSKTCLIDNTGPVQISSPRNLGIKRRKSQAKKVVCIPAPAPPNSRPSGEVVPSDLWAWRKYGQKPIKGSPYPRGYYRCSSSKGCSARKQVERSRTDPNMLVITYTSEHNHPWPTQRNALAGSTRSQPPKNTTSAASKSSSPTGSHPQKLTNKEEQKESSNDTLSPTTNVASSSTVGGLVKEEVEESDQKLLEMDDTELISEGFPQSYRPAMPDSNDQDFFADLGEIDGDPLELLFSQGFNEDDHKQGKALNPFSIFDWSTDNNNGTSFEEAKRSI